MTDISIYQDITTRPTDDNLAERLGNNYELWKKIKGIVLDLYPAGYAEWNYPGKNYGWSFRIKDKKRAIVYFLPRDKYFKLAFVFGQKATDLILDSDISPIIKEELKQAKKYAEGRGIRITIKDDSLIPDIKKLIEIKLSN